MALALPFPRVLDGSVLLAGALGRRRFRRLAVMGRIVARGVERFRCPTESLMAALLTLLAERAADSAVTNPLGAAYDAFLMERAQAAMNADVTPDEAEEDR
jgi:hypothetical protein